MSEKEEKWFYGEREHEGCPLQIRFPLTRDYRSVQPNLPLLVWIIHRLSEVNEKGLPTKKYNDSLKDFDATIIAGLPCPVLIETFGGNRTFYGYAPETFDLGSLQIAIESSFPNESFDSKSKLDPNWKLLKSYSQEISFYNR